MNILKEQIKLSVAYPGWRSAIKKLKSNKNKKIFLFGTPMHGNLGDHAIAIQEQYFFEDFFPDYEYFEILMPMYHTQKKIIKNTVTPEDLVVISGGGWMGNLWIPEELLIQQIIKDFVDKKIVIFPQTIYFDKKIVPFNALISSANEIFSKCKDITLCVREKKSFEFAINNYLNIKVIKVPDIALSFYQWAPKNKFQLNKKVGVCLRKDRESYVTDENKQCIINWFRKNGYTIEWVDTMNECRVSIEEREQTVFQRLKAFASYDFVITDRLHGMIFSYICGTPCILFDNKTHKISGVYDTWLSKSKRIFPIFERINIDDLKVFVKSDFNFEENVCPLALFDDLKGII